MPDVCCAPLRCAPQPRDSHRSACSREAAPGSVSNLSSLVSRSRPPSRSSLGVRTMKANPAPSRGKSKARGSLVRQNGKFGHLCHQLGASTRRRRAVSQPPRGQLHVVAGIGSRRRHPKEGSGSVSACHFARQQKPLAVEMPLPPALSIPPALSAASAPLRSGKSLQRRPPVHPPNAAGSRKGKSICVQNPTATRLRSQRRRSAADAASRRSATLQVPVEVKLEVNEVINKARAERDFWDPSRGGRGGSGPPRRESRDRGNHHIR